MKMLLSLAAGAAILALAASPAAAMDGFHFGGGASGGFEASSSGSSGGSNWGNGHVSERYSWAGTVAEDSGAMNLAFDSETGFSGSADISTSASAGAGNYIKTTGVGANTTGSYSAAGVSGSFSGGAHGGGFSN